MYLTRYTDYSLRVLIYLGLKQDQPVTIREIADNYGISHNHLTKAVHQLGRHGYIRTVRGKSGGVSLARAPELINIGEVVRTGERFNIVECFNAAKNNCRIAPLCTLMKVLDEALGSFLATLNRYTLANILQDQRGLSALLGFSQDKVNGVQAAKSQNPIF